MNKTTEISESAPMAASELTDVISYTGNIAMLGYEVLSDLIKEPKARKALLVLSTFGGDPHAGFRIARALQCHYEEFSLLVPRYCKSAGTLVAIGASHLYLDDRSELGPLDVQVKKHDELVTRNSGLDILGAVEYLQTQTMQAFSKYCVNLANAGLSTKLASEISTQLAVQTFSPIAAQIDPMKLAEMQRAMDIAYAYGERLNEKGQNLRQHGLNQLAAGYPSHSFVIDRKEARKIFEKVSRPSAKMRVLGRDLQKQLGGATNGEPRLNFFGALGHIFEGDGDASAIQQQPSPTKGDGGIQPEQTQLPEAARPVQRRAKSRP